MHRARLGRYGLLSVSGEDARDFLHAQLTNDVQGLAPDRAALAGWCSAQGRLLATFLVIPSPQGFLLQLARDLAPTVAKRLGMFVLRSKVKVADESANWVQDGIWDADFQQPDLAWRDGVATVRVGERRYIQLGLSITEQPNASEEDWILGEIRAGRPFISSATQDKFVPQMVNLEKLGGVDFQKGCYPGQEIVARAQYRGQVKRRMVQMQGAARAGEEFGGGTVVDAAGGELLVVAPV
ncbi:MAG: tRNA-modifying protein YgfZ [Betaproteobacteria bacterium]|jgi:folate-binding protein YgfZ|nr:tRNA-modifying protein YgfZ [Betaproteobacteria bacterium]